MSTLALDPHDTHGQTPVLSDVAAKVAEKIPDSLKGIFAKTKARVTQALAMPGQIKAMIEKVKDGHPLSKAEWATIMATPGSMLIVGYYALKVAENTTNTVIEKIRSQYHSMLEGLGLRKDATPDEFPEAILQKEAESAHTSPTGDTDGDHGEKPTHLPVAETADVGSDAHAANDDHTYHHNVEHPGEHAKAA